MHCEYVLAKCYVYNTYLLLCRLRYFVPHATAVGFAMPMDRFRTSLGLPMLHPSRPHPALVHAVILWSLRLSQDPNLMQHEYLFFQRAILALQNAIGGGAELDVGRFQTLNPARTDTRLKSMQDLSVSRRRIDAIQAEGLLTSYLNNLGRIVEGEQHACAAASLTIVCGLHRLQRSSVRAPSESPSDSNLGARLRISTREGMRVNDTGELVQAQNADELEERINVFWSIFGQAKAWSSISGIPCLIEDMSTQGTRIDTPWPTTASPGTGGSERTLQRFFAGEMADMSEKGSLNSSVGIRARAAALHERATRASTRWHSCTSIQTRSLNSFDNYLSATERLGCSSEPTRGIAQHR
jgi:hypothetical protein